MGGFTMKVGQLEEVLGSFNSDADVEGELLIGGILIDLEKTPIGAKRGPKPGNKKPYTGKKRGPKPKKITKKNINKNVKKTNSFKKIAKKEEKSTSDKIE
jgi:hypothetical protein